ncbi:MAG TPA: glutamate--cysteine ligase, partial [Solirubrobacteraceae bacterium]|nr:glutamate--cysteine ligase [Solirubrobacteraceae bacterium]
LIVACVAQATRDIDEGVPFQAQPARLIEENMWRAIRFGLDGRLIDFERVQEYPARDTIARLADWTAPVRAELGIDPVFPERNGAQRQHALIQAGARREEVFATCVRETRQTYSEEVTV